MIVELIGKSLTGVITLAKNQGATTVRAATKLDGLWRLRVELPEAR